MSQPILGRSGLGTRILKYLYLGQVDDGRQFWQVVFIEVDKGQDGDEALANILAVHGVELVEIDQEETAEVDIETVLPSMRKNPSVLDGFRAASGRMWILASVPEEEESLFRRLWAAVRGVWSR